MDAQRRALDELMGAGLCPRIHDLKLKESLEKSSRHDSYVPRFEAELAEFCEKLVKDLDRKVKQRSRERVAQDLEVTPPSISSAKSEQILVLEGKIKKLLDQVEALGEAGKVDEAKALMNEVSSNQQVTKCLCLPRKKIWFLARHVVQCSEQNAPSMTQTHLIGRLHIGNQMVRDFLSEFKRKQREKGYENRKQQRERERDREHDRYGYHKRSRCHSPTRHGRHKR